MYPTLEAKLFSNSGQQGLAGINVSQIKKYFGDQQKYANKLTDGNLRIRFEVNEMPYQKKVGKGYAYNYFKDRNWDINRVMADVKSWRPDLFKPEYLPSQTATAVPAKSESNLPAAIEKTGIQKYLTKRNAMIGGGVLVGGAILYSLFK